MQKEILGYKCKKCGHVMYPYRSRCSKCHETVFEGVDIVFDTVPLAHDGTLLTYTDVYALPPEFEVAKLTLGIVQLDDGHRVTGQLRVAEPKIGMKLHGEVEVVRKSEYAKHYGMVFSKA
ncbi:MAG TPA: OB-fold domain-containing protein [Polyangia bacterium]|jgi:uncharacterized OB-fold protein